MPNTHSVQTQHIRTHSSMPTKSSNAKSTNQMLESSLVTFSPQTRNNLQTHTLPQITKSFSFQTPSSKNIQNLFPQNSENLENKTQTHSLKKNQTHSSPSKQKPTKTFKSPSSTNNKNLFPWNPKPSTPITTPNRKDSKLFTKIYSKALKETPKD